jgi:hypothetical protein
MNVSTNRDVHIDVDTQTDAPSYDATSAIDAKSHAVSLLATLK